MKKLMFAAAVAAGLAAFGDGIESANTVGYNTLDWMAKSTYYMMGAQFETAAGASLKLSEIDFGDLSAAPLFEEFFDEDMNIVGTAPQVQVANANSEGFIPYYFLKDGSETYGPGWVDGAGNPADPTIVAGLGFWFFNPSSNSPVVTTAGGVVGDASVEKTFDNTYRVLVNPYPVAVKLSEIDFDGITAASPLFENFFDEDMNIVGTAPQVQVPNASSEGFMPYYFLQDGSETYGPGWVDGAGNPADPTIPVGRGCWFKPNASTMTVTFTAP